MKRGRPPYAMCRGTLAVVRLLSELIAYGESPSYLDMAYDCGLHPRDVGCIVAGLERAGWVTVRRRPGRRNEYTLKEI
jgi:hypothetical protein